MPTMTGSQFLADMMHAKGITHIFFVPVVVTDINIGAALVVDG